MFKSDDCLDSVMIQYVRKGDNTKIGMMVSGVNEDGEVCFGWSLCNKLDVFSKKKAFEIASGRALSNHRIDEPAYHILDEIPLTVIGQMHIFINRMLRYYSNNVFTILVENIISSLVGEKDNGNDIIEECLKRR